MEVWLPNSKQLIVYFNLELWNFAVVRFIDQLVSQTLIMIENKSIVD